MIEDGRCSGVVSGDVLLVFAAVVSLFRKKLLLLLSVPPSCVVSQHNTYTHTHTCTPTPITPPQKKATSGTGFASVQRQERYVQEDVPRLGGGAHTAGTSRGSSERGTSEAAARAAGARTSSRQGRTGSSSGWATSAAGREAGGRSSVGGRAWRCCRGCGVGVFHSSHSSACTCHRSVSALLQ